MTWNQQQEEADAEEQIDRCVKFSDHVALVVSERKRAFEAWQKAQQLQAELDKLKAAHAWIKTSERMPDEDTRKIPVVIQSMENKRVEIADYYFGSWSIGDNGNGLEWYESVTHWMPRLEPPK